MNPKQIVKFSTKKTKGLFVSVPYMTNVDFCHFINVDKNKILHIVYMGMSGKWESQHIRMPKGNYTILGFSNKLTDSQIEALGLSYYKYLNLLGEKEITVNYSDSSNYWLVLILNI
jgi:hypothetical protein